MAAPSAVVATVDQLFADGKYEAAAAAAARALQKGGQSDDVAKLLSRRSEVRERTKTVARPLLLRLLAGDSPPRA
jgi:hypothetical protein